MDFPVPPQWIQTVPMPHQDFPLFDEQEFQGQKSQHGHQSLSVLCPPMNHLQIPPSNSFQSSNPEHPVSPAV